MIRLVKLLRCFNIEIIIVLLTISGCSSDVIKGPGYYNVSSFHFAVERVDYAEDINAVKPRHLCNLTGIYIENVSVCYKCIDNESVLPGWTEKGAIVCPG